jgi:hypothetical protein
MIKSIKYQYTFVVCLTFLPLLIFSQKLPKIQKESVIAPVDISVDGKSKEFNDIFKAYNPNNRIFYTISNDNDNLYLTIKAKEPVAVEKLIIDGTTLIISKGTSKTNKFIETDNISLTFPKNDITHTGVEGGAEYYDTYKKDTVANKEKIRLIYNKYNRLALSKFKKIDIKGIKEILDSTITVDNDYGIKAMAQYNDKMEMVYELALPIKYLGLSPNSRFSYCIRLNGTPDIEKVPLGTPRGPIVTNEGHDGRIDFEQQYLNFETDLRGEYTLAKKK